MTLRTAATLVGCVIMLVSGQVLVKTGLTSLGGFTLSVHGLGREIAKVLTSLPIWAGVGLTALSSLLWFDVLSRVELSYAYPLLSMSYVLMLFASWWILHEPPSTVRWVGVLVICLGVFLVSRS